MYRQFKKEPEHGTRSGHAWHTRDMKEPSCDACREAERAYWRNQRKIRKEEINSKRRIWRYNTPNARRNFRRNGSDPGNYSEKDVIETYGTLCHICNEEIDMDAPRQCGKPGWERALHIDHVYPLSKGGTDTLDNVRPSHGECNIKKWAKIPL